MNKLKIAFTVFLFLFTLLALKNKSEAAYSCKKVDPTFNESWKTSSCYKLNDAVGYRCTTPVSKSSDSIQGGCSVRPGYSSCGGTSSKCGRYLYLDQTCKYFDRNEDGYVASNECIESRPPVWNSEGCQCNGSAACKPKKVDCSGRCGSFSNGCGGKVKCGGCSNGYYCTSSKYCKKSGNSCTSYTCDNSSPDQDCGNHTNGSCSGTKDCGPCPAGYSCKGKNANGLNGTCKKNPEPEDPTYTITVLVFYDKYGNGLKKGSEPAYNLCYPATNSSGAGNTSGNVTVKINGKTYTKKMYKNCKRDGKNNTSARGFQITGLKKKTNTVQLVTPNGSTYDVTGYNYTKSSGGGTKVVVSGSQAQLRKTPPIAGNFTVRFGVEKVTKPNPPSQVSGFVFIDTNENGIYEPDDNDETLCYNKNINIRVGSTNNAYASKADCTPFSFDISGTQTVSLNPVPSGYIATGLEYIDENNPANADDEFNLGAVGASSVSLNGESEVHFGIKPADATFTVSGNIYVDSTTPRKKTSGESNYTGATSTNRTITVTDEEGTVVDTIVQPTNGSGFTTAADLNSGIYTFTYGGPPSGYDMTYPNPAPGGDASFTVRIGANCNTNSHNDASCDADGNITNLNFGISTIGGDPWYQTVGGDLRDDSSNVNRIPSGAACSYTSQYASSNRTSQNDAGLVFNSNTSLDLGASGSQNPRANPSGRLITGKKFKPARGGGIRTEHAYLNSVSTKGGQTPKSMFSGGNNANPPCTGAKPDCTFPATSTSTFTSGTYTSNAGLNFNGSGNYTFGNSKKFVFLIQGNLTINRNIIVNPGASVAFIATGNIIVAPNVTRIDGIYSANKDFVIEDSTSPNGESTKLVVNGSVVANASNTNGKFDNQRTNGTGSDGDSRCPSVQIIANPGLILNAPSALKVPNYSIAEVAPGPISSSDSGSAPTLTPTLTPTPTPTPIPTSTPTPTPAPDLLTGYGSTNGTITIDAEASSPLASRIGRSSRTWDTRTSPLTYTNSGYIAALPDSGTNLQTNLSTTAPEVKYNVCFPEAGRYYIWTRGSAPDSAGDAIAYGLDGSIPSSANPAMLYIKDVDGSSDWQWKGKLNDDTRVYIDVPTAGFHNFSLYMRNDGARVDKIYLTDASASPSFAGTSNGGPSSNDSTTCADNR